VLALLLIHSVLAQVITVVVRPAVTHRAIELAGSCSPARCC